MKQVSIIVPCYNEEATVCLLLDALLCQTYPLDNMEVIIADGMSTDRTRQRITEFIAEHPRMNLQIVDNHLRAIPSGLNRAIEASRGEYLIRLDAHSIPANDYIERCVVALEGRMGDNVGGIWNIQAANDGWIARSIATAASHPLGVGDALYRLRSSAQEVDTVPFGAFRRDLAFKIGLFNEGLLTNEDYEFNTRIRLAGGKIWLDPEIKSTYIARSTLNSLAKQYWRYGYWKAKMLRRYPTTVRWRQALPPLFSASLIFLFIAGFFYSWFWVILIVELFIYLMIILLAGLQTALLMKSIGYIAGLPISIAIMHLSWGTAFIWGFINPSSAYLTKK